MDEFDNVHAFVDRFFAMVTTRVPRNASLKSSQYVANSCLRLSEAIGQGENLRKAARITMVSLDLVASMINQFNASKIIFLDDRMHSCGCVCPLKFYFAY